LNRRLATLSKWADKPAEERVPLDLTRYQYNSSMMSVGHRPAAGTYLGSHGSVNGMGHIPAAARIGPMAVECVNLANGRALRRFLSVRDAAAFVGTTTNKIYACVDGQRHSTYGFGWRRALSREGEIPDISKEELMVYCRQKLPVSAAAAMAMASRPTRGATSLTGTGNNTSSSSGAYAGLGTSYGSFGSVSSSQTTGNGSELLFHMLSLKDGRILKVFPTARAAANFLQQEHPNKIYLCVNGNKRAAHGFAWKRASSDQTPKVGR
jgi:hypothetical protein